MAADSLHALSDCWVAKTLSPTECEQLLGVCKLRVLDAGATVFSVGDSVNSLYFVREGSVELTVEGVPPGHGVTLRRGATLGDLGLFSVGVSAVGARTAERAKLYELPHDAFKRLRDQPASGVPKLLRELTASMARRLRDCNDRLEHGVLERDGLAGLEPAAGGLANTGHLQALADRVLLEGAAPTRGAAPEPSRGSGRTRQLSSAPVMLKDEPDDLEEKPSEPSRGGMFGIFSSVVKSLRGDDRK